MDEHPLASVFDFEPTDIIASEVIEHPRPTNDRSTARRAALQVLYEVDSTAHPLGTVLQEQLKANALKEKAADYLRQLVMGVSQNRVQLDRVIQHFASEWPLDQVAIVDRNILRIAIYEFAISTKIPVSVAIDEAVELGKLFGSESTPRFVNGVLGTLAENLEALRQFFHKHGQATARPTTPDPDEEKE